MKKIRIFISSPGDVQQERNIARKVICELNSIYSKYAEIEVLMWEDFPLTTESTFQEGIDFFIKNEQIDFAVFILWSRLGTPLCKKFTKPDGSPYHSGTEYEYDLMRDLQRQKGAPRILTYVKTKDIVPTVKTKDELFEFFQQKESVKTFLSEHFYDESTNSNYAYLQFDEQTTFEQNLKNHLKELIRQSIGDVNEIREWDGNPYVGLKSFEYEQSSIFYGRRHLVYDVTSQLLENENVKRSLIVIGESGSGKSSFVKAGLLPFLCRDNKTGYLIITPSMFGAKLYQGIIDLLVDNYAFLDGNPFIEDLRTDISENTNFKHLQYALNNTPHQDVILYLDQFEELFNDNQISEEERKKVILLLKGIASTQSISIFFSLRSDFYNRFSIYGSLAQLKEMSIVVDIPMIGLTDIAEIVDEPAKKACLKWEIDQKGSSLNDTIIKDASIIKDLPLIEFALSELYNLRNENNCLTFSAYKQIGRLKGAIVAYANNFYNNLNDEERSTLNEVLGYVISVSTTQQSTYVRKTSLLNELQKDKRHSELTQKLIDAHIFVTGKSHDGQATVSIVHETLIDNWDVIKKWIDTQQDFLKSNSYYEQRAQHWIEAHKSTKELIQERTALLEVEYFLFKYSKQTTELARDFLLNSIRKDRRKGIIWQTILAALFAISAICLIFTKLAGFQYDSDMNEYVSFNESSLWEILLSLLIPYSILCHSLIIKYLSIPKYKTIYYSLLYWILLLGFCTIYLYDTDFYLSLIYFIPVISVLISVAQEARTRWIWKKRKVVTYNISDRWMERLKSLTIGLVVVLAIGFMPMVMMFTLQEKNEKLDRTLVIADELFDGLNNISTLLSPKDNHYINNKRKSYLEERFPEEIFDSIPDDRNYQYSIALYNMSMPDEAIRYIHYDKSWRDHLMAIKCLMLEGDYILAEYAIEDYVKSSRVDDFGWLSAKDLIWTTEKLGRFDLTERIYELFETNNVDINDLASIINKAHLFLSQGNMDAAIDKYKEAFALNPQTQHNIEQDFHILNRFASIDVKLLEQAAMRMNFNFAPAFSAKDPLTTSRIYEKLNGNWIWIDENTNANQFIMSVDTTRNFVRYHSFEYQDTTWQESYRFISHIRFNDTENGIIWDEYNPINDGNSYCILEEITDSLFVVKIIQNGNPADTDTHRTYYKIKDSNNE